MKCLVVYSSVTGNTRSVAEAIHAVLPHGTAIAPVYKAPDPDEFVVLAVGFWVRRAMPVRRMRRYMQRVRGKNVGWFGTLAAWPDSDHAAKVRAHANSLLSGNKVAGGFLCQGRLASKRFNAAMNRGKYDTTHPLTEERKTRLIEAGKHPNEDDFIAARLNFEAFLLSAIFENNV